MNDDYSVMLVACNERIEYRDADGVYRFDVARGNGRWVVYLPCAKGDPREMHELTCDEQRRVVPRIAGYLSGRRGLDASGPAFAVNFERRHPAAAAMTGSAGHMMGFWKRQPQ